MEIAPRLRLWTRMPPFALIVDRDADTRAMYAEYLRLSACRVDEAEDGREALAKAIAHHHDVIVTETRLPGINGFELCTLLRQDVTTRSIPIVVVTGDAFADDVLRAKNSGADAVLVKPCLPERLLEEIARVIDMAATLRGRAAEVIQKVRAEVARSDELIDRSQANRHKRMMRSRAYNRRDTTEPPVAPPALVCPACDFPLRYDRSHIGGVSERHKEQWDYFECAKGCGTFQYRQRTRKLRKVYP